MLIAKLSGEGFLTFSEYVQNHQEQTATFGSKMRG